MEEENEMIKVKSELDGQRKHFKSHRVVKSFPPRKLLP